MNGAQRAAIARGRERAKLARIDDAMGGRAARLGAMYGCGKANRPALVKEPGGGACEALSASFGNDATRED